MSIDSLTMPTKQLLYLYFMILMRRNPSVLSLPISTTVNEMVERVVSEVNSRDADIAYLWKGNDLGVSSMNE